MPSKLEERIQADMMSALKNKETVRLSVLRMLKASMQMLGTERGREGGITDEDVQVLIRRAIKQRQEAAEQYRAGNAAERAAEELAEAEILSTYLPSQMDDRQLEDVIARVIAETGAVSMKDIGRVMSGAMQEVQGRADGKRVKAFAQKLLGQ